MDIYSPVSSTLDAYVPVALGTNAFTCPTCGSTFDAERKLTAHAWSKHGVRCSIREYIGDISICMACHTDFKSRARLVKHLLEKRIRSTTRGISCRDAFVRSSPAKIEHGLFCSLEARDAQVAQACRLKGHTSVIAKGACKRGAPSVLKRI